MSGVLAAYERLVASGELKPDPDQRRAAERLASLQKELESESGGGLLARLFARREQPRGVYLWGGVGRGKSMLMDLFVGTLGIVEKRRVHFHEFMLEVDRLLRDERAKEAGDPIVPVAAHLAANIKCLAFDEMVVTNTADAAIMSRLFTALIRDEGVTVVTTSNRPPRDLYKDGLNRSLFLPFIDLIEAELDVIPLNGPTDYRLDRLAGLDAWHTPLGEAATALSDALKLSIKNSTEWGEECSRSGHPVARATRCDRALLPDVRSGVPCARSVPIGITLACRASTSHEATPSRGSHRARPTEEIAR